MFYEANKIRLQAQVNTLLENAEPRDINDIKALIVLHVGYIYSGDTAAEAYHAIKPGVSRIKRVVLYGPAHRVYLTGMAIPSVDRFKMNYRFIRMDWKLLLKGLCWS